MVDNGIGIVIFFVFGFLAFVGGVPQLFRWAKPIPNLKIVKVMISKLPNDNYKYQIHLEIKNVAKMLRRTSDASNVAVEYFILNKSGVQWTFVSNQSVAPYLLAGTTVMKDIEAFHSLLPEGNPYSVIFRVTCNEGIMAKKKINFNGATTIAS